MGSTLLPMQWIPAAPFLVDMAGWSWSWPTYQPVVQRLRLCGAWHLITKCTFLACRRTMFFFHFSLFNRQVPYLQNVCLTNWGTISHGDWIQFQEWNCTITGTQQNPLWNNWMSCLHCELVTEFIFVNVHKLIVNLIKGVACCSSGVF